MFGHFRFFRSKMSRGLPPAPAITSTPELTAALQREGKKHNQSQQGARRIQAVLLSIGGVSKSETARQVKMGRSTVQVNRDRWQNAFPDLVRHVEGYQAGKVSQTELDRLVMSVLEDKPRPGRNKIFTLTQEKLIVALATESPHDYGIPINNWTMEMLANVAAAQKIVEKISASQTRRILKKSALTSS